jgi:putative transposase
MPWKEVLPMEERVSFVMEVKKKEQAFAHVCRRFGISRKTGYKWWQRFCEHGLGGLGKRSSRPQRSPRASGVKWRNRVIELRRERPWWGAKKLRAKLITQHGAKDVPAASTLGTMLVRAGLVRSRRRRQRGPQLERAQLARARQSNEIWAADFKGWLRMANGTRCDPLTVSDLASRYVLCCQALRGQSLEQVKPVFERLFKRYGLPRSIRVDNGAPFGSRGAGGLSRLSVWWMRLGIGVQFIAPAHPEQNGVHERMHRTLKLELRGKPASTLRHQQERFDQWRRHFNLERPHEALGQQPPALHYQSSPRLYQQKESSQPIYPEDHCVRRVRSNGEIRWRGRKRFLGEALVGQLVGIKQTGAGQSEVYFMERLLGTLHEADICGLRPTAYARKHQRKEQQKVLPTCPF